MTKTPCENCKRQEECKAYNGYCLEWQCYYIPKTHEVKPREVR